MFHLEKSQFYSLGHYRDAVTIISQLPFVSRLVLTLHKGHHLEGSVGMTEFPCKPDEGFGLQALPVSLMHWGLKLGIICPRLILPGAKPTPSVREMSENIIFL